MKPLSIVFGSIILDKIGVSEWISAFLALASILVIILLILSFSNLFIVLKSAREVKKTAKDIPVLKRRLEEALTRIKKLENRKNIEEMEECLRGLISDDENDRYTAALELGEIGTDLCLGPLKNALKKESSIRVRDEIIKSIGKIEERSKYKK